jgi:aminopeptidase N
MQGPATFGDVEAHEIGHQWFYGLVGNDQGRDPWLDEGLATWAEGRFQDSLTAMRLAKLPADARGHLGEPMTYWKGKPDVYQAGVYTQGAQALDALGPGDLVDCALRVYVAQNAYRVARPADLAAALSAVFPDAKPTLERFGAKL